MQLDCLMMFVILQKYDFSSKSQRTCSKYSKNKRCLWYCKSTIFQANHNYITHTHARSIDVCDTAKVRFFKQITTKLRRLFLKPLMFVILQKYDFSSKSQLRNFVNKTNKRCLWYCKSTIFQANHNKDMPNVLFVLMFVILQKYDFSSKSQQDMEEQHETERCLWYCKSTIFQANHNSHCAHKFRACDVCDTAKVRFFKQITTVIGLHSKHVMMFVILQKYDFSSKSQRDTS